MIYKRIVTMVINKLHPRNRIIQETRTCHDLPVTGTKVGIETYNLRI